MSRLPSLVMLLSNLLRVLNKILRDVENNKHFKFFHLSASKLVKLLSFEGMDQNAELVDGSPCLDT